MNKKLTDKIKQWAIELGFQTVGISDTNLSHYENDFYDSLAKNYHGEMDFLTHHIEKRFHPEKLMPNTKSIICVSIYYYTKTNTSNISCYAQLNDYHKIIKEKLKLLANKIENEIGSFAYRAFSDSAPVIEKALAEKAGNGWIGKNCLLLNQQVGSFCFLGELFTDLELDCTSPTQNRCGNCSQCLNACPTNALIAPQQLNASRCISYLTIEHKGAIPVELRPLIGTKIVGCDQCQLVCPYNQTVQLELDPAFIRSQNIDSDNLIKLFNWNENEFDKNISGTVIERIGFECWQRNIAIALGNSPYSEKIIATLKLKLNDCSDLVKEHIEWAIQNQLIHRARHRIKIIKI